MIRLNIFESLVARVRYHLFPETRRKGSVVMKTKFQADVQRVSWITTQTRKLIEKVKIVNPRVKVAGTRKTLFKLMAKKAIILGGGEPHRFSLSDAILIKDNHLALVPLEEAIKRAKDFSIYKVVEIEVEDLEDALKAAKLGVDVIMLDNMTPGQVEETLKALENEGLRKKVKIEVSGGITEENIQDYARLDIDVISLGALTHSAKNFDVSLKIVKD